MRSYSDIMDRDKWRVLIVDDEPDVVSVTKLVLGDYEFGGKRVEFLQAGSAR